MKQLKIKNWVYHIVLLAFLCSQMTNAWGAPTSSSAKKLAVESGDIIGQYELMTRGRNNSVVIKSFTIREGNGTGDAYWMEWQINRYRSADDQQPLNESTSGGGSFKGKTLDIQLTGDIASGSECNLRIFFAENTANIKSDKCTQRNNPNGVYIKEALPADSQPVANIEPIGANSTEASEESSDDKKIYYFRGQSKKFGSYQNRLEIGKVSGGETYAAIETNWYPDDARPSNADFDLRSGSLKVKGNVARGVLIGDTSDTGWCEVTVTFIGETINLQTGKCDLTIPASGFYRQR